MRSPLELLVTSMLVEVLPRKSASTYPLRLALPTLLVA
jgi:hypothetical protein